MRLLIVEPGPAFSVQDVHNGWRSAFVELGVTTASMNFNDRLDFYSQAALNQDGEWAQAFTGEQAIQMASKQIHSVTYEFWPDVIVFTSCLFVPARTLQLLKSRGHKIVMLLTESPYEDDSQLMRAEYADVTLINDPKNLDRFLEVCPNSYYQPHSYNPYVHHPRPVRDGYASDVAFVGTGFPSRIDYLEKVDWEGIDLMLAGEWSRLSEDSPLRGRVGHPLNECLDNNDTVDVYCSTKASFNLYRVEAEREGLEEGWACGPREIELAATRTWFARQTRPESDELFPMLPTFETPAELGDVLRWALANPDSCSRAAAEAQAAIADRTFTNAAKKLLSLLA